MRPKGWKLNFYAVSKEILERRTLPRTSQGYALQTDLMGGRIVVVRVTDFGSITVKATEARRKKSAILQDIADGCKEEYQRSAMRIIQLTEGRIERKYQKMDGKKR